LFHYTGEPNFKHFFPAEKHPNDFNYVYLWESETRTIFARRCLSLSYSKILSVKKVGNNTRVNTELFIVDLENALKHDEISIIEKEPADIRYNLKIPDLVQSIIELNESFEIGLITIKEFEDPLNDKLFLYYMWQKKWITKYRMTFLTVEPYHRIMKTNHLEAEYLFT